MKVTITKVQKENIMKKIQNIVLIIAAFLFIGCSPIDKVKWSKVDLLGNEISVQKIVSRIRGNSGEVIWTHHSQKIIENCDVVSVSINSKPALYFLIFSYDRSENKCRLLEYRINGQPESPLYIYKFLSANGNNYIPEFIEPFLQLF